MKTPDVYRGRGQRLIDGYSNRLQRELCGGRNRRTSVRKEMRSRYADMEAKYVKNECLRYGRSLREQYEQTYCRSVFVLWSELWCRRKVADRLG